MTIDDPKLTAYALDELPPDERAEVEAELARDPERAAEVAELRAFVARLRAELATEENLELTEDGRAAMLEAARSPAEPPRRFFSRLQIWLPSAIAACLMLFLWPRFFHQSPAPMLLGEDHRAATPAIRVQAETTKYLHKDADEMPPAPGEAARGFSVGGTVQTKPQEPAVVEKSLAAELPAAAAPASDPAAASAVKLTDSNALTNFRKDMAQTATPSKALPVDRVVPPAAPKEEATPLPKAAGDGWVLSPDSAAKSRAQDPMKRSEERRTDPDSAAPVPGAAPASPPIHPFATVDGGTLSYPAAPTAAVASREAGRNKSTAPAEVNAFNFDYPPASDDLPCSVTLEIASCPWAPEHRLARIGLRAREGSDAPSPTSMPPVQAQIHFNPRQVASSRQIGYEAPPYSEVSSSVQSGSVSLPRAGEEATLLYEIVPADSSDLSKSKSELRQTVTARPQASGATRERGNEMLTVQLGWKDTAGGKTSTREFSLQDSGQTWQESTPDFRWAAAVAGFGLMLHDSPSKGAATWDLVRELAREGRGNDPTGQRQKFLQRIEQARSAKP